VNLGGVNRTKNENGESHSTVQTFTSTEAIPHENYDDGLLINDIAIIVLPESPALTLGICLKNNPGLKRSQLFRRNNQHHPAT
jgi:hypothetical protein